MDSQTNKKTEAITPEQIAIAEPKPAKYSGIEAGKTTKVLDSNGKLVSVKGRHVECFFDKTLMTSKKAARKSEMHKFQKELTERRASELEKKEVVISQHANNILALPDAIGQNNSKECKFVNKKQFKKLIQADIEIYLSYKIKCCNSGKKLIELKQEVNRLNGFNKLPDEIINSLNKKIKAQMAVLVKKMPKHLNSIDYSKEPHEACQVTMKKCEAVKSLVVAAKTIDDSIFELHRKVLRDMMINVFSRDVKEITKLCLAQNDLKENIKLSTFIDDVKNTTIKPFFEEVSSNPDRYHHKLEIKITKQKKELEAQRNIIPNLISKLERTLTTASETIEKESAHMLEKQKQLNKKTAYKKKLENAFRPMKFHYNKAIKNADDNIEDLNKRSEKKLTKFKMSQKEYKSLYAKLNLILEQFKCSDILLADPKENLAADIGVELESWKRLRKFAPMSRPKESNLSPALESFNHACFHSHFDKLALKQDDWLDVNQIENLKSIVQTLKTESSDKEETYERLVIAQTAYCLAKKEAYQKAKKKKHRQAKRQPSTVTQHQLNTAINLRIAHSQPVAVSEPYKTSSSPACGIGHMNVELGDDRCVNNNHPMNIDHDVTKPKVPTASNTIVHHENITANSTSGIPQEFSYGKQQTNGGHKPPPPAPPAPPAPPPPPPPPPPPASSAENQTNKGSSRVKGQKPRRTELLAAIQRGVRLNKTTYEMSDKSAPRLGDSRPDPKTGQRPTGHPLLDAIQQGVTLRSAEDRMNDKSAPNSRGPGQGGGDRNDLERIFRDGLNKMKGEIPLYQSTDHDNDDNDDNNDIWLDKDDKV